MKWQQLQGIESNNNNKKEVEVEGVTARKENLFKNFLLLQTTESSLLIIS